MKPGNLIFIIISLSLGIAAQIIIKYSLLQIPPDLLDGEWVNFVNKFSVTVIFTLSIGVIFYFFSMITWILSLRNMPLSKAYPILGASYPIIYIIAVLWSPLNESANPNGITGIILVSIGVIFVTWERKSL